MGKKMKFKQTMVITAIAAASSFAANATGESGQINFVGSIYEDSCAVSVEGGSTINTGGAPATATVIQLPPAAYDDFGTVAATAGRTNFDIQLTGCDVDKTQVELALMGSFVNEFGVVQGVYDNSATITDMGFQILGNTQTGATPAAQDWRTVTLMDDLSATPIDASSGVYKFPMSVSYYALTAGNVAPGIVRGTVNYLVSYQ